MKTGIFFRKKEDGALAAVGGEEEAGVSRFLSSVAIINLLTDETIEILKQGSAKIKHTQGTRNMVANGPLRILLPQYDRAVDLREKPRGIAKRIDFGEKVTWLVSEVGLREDEL